MRDLVSIIIPVYNTQRYLNQCVESVCAQTYGHLEILLVNDGSTDNSGSLCDAWAKKDPRVQALHQSNSGPGQARNTGLHAATGKWVLFLDSDDWYETPLLIETLLQTAQQHGSDIVCMNYKRFYESSKTFSSPLCHVPATEQNILSSLIAQNVYTSSPALKLIRRSLLADSRLLFETNILSEDVEFCAKLLALACKISFCESAVYIYRMRSHSITTSIGKKHVADLLYVVQKMASTKNAGKPFYDYLAFQYCTLCINMHLAKVNKETEQKVYSLKFLLKSTGNKTVKLVALCSRLLGIRITAYLLYIYFLLSSGVNKQS